MRLNCKFISSSVLLILPFLLTISWPVQAKDYCSDFFCIRTIETNTSVRFLAINKNPHLTVSTIIQLELKNARADVEKPLRFTVGPDQKVPLFRVRAEKNKKWRYNFKYRYRYGDIFAKHDENAQYLLPVEPGAIVRISQGCNQKFSHKGKRGFATDFPLKTGTPIHAARGGKVVSVREDSNKGGRTIKFAKHANHVYIEHEDGTLGIYLHLVKNGALVDPGDSVKAGDLIAKAGNTGWSTEPHLHFEVVKPGNDDKLSFNSIKINYKTATGSVTCPHATRLTAAKQ